MNKMRSEAKRQSIFSRRKVAADDAAMCVAAPEPHAKRIFWHWHKFAAAYKSLISSEQFDSIYLREKGLFPNIIDLIGDCSASTLLDAGTGTGWLFDRIEPKHAFACDIVKPESLARGVAFEVADVSNLPFGECIFDVVVASLLLLYCKDLHDVCAELRRVTKPSGKLVVAIMNPYFYRTGGVESDGTFRLERDLSLQVEFDFKIGEEVGPFRYHYRSLPDYINTFVETGWDVITLKDWFVDIQDYERTFRGRKRGRILRTGRIPMFTFVQCKAR